MDASQNVMVALFMMIAQCMSASYYYREYTGHYDTLNYSVFSANSKCKNRYTHGYKDHRQLSSVHSNEQYTSVNAQCLVCLQYVNSIKIQKTIHTSFVFESHLMIIGLD